MVNNKYSGIIQIAQNIGRRENKIISNLVEKEILSSSRSSFLNVVKRQAIEAKLNADIKGVIKGNIKINNIKIAFIPKKNFNLRGITLTVLSIESKVCDTLLANNIRKNSQEILNTKGHKNFTIKIVKFGSVENHSLKSTKLKIIKIVIGKIIIVIKTIRRLTIIPLISLGIIDMVMLSLIFFLKCNSGPTNLKSILSHVTFQDILQLHCL